MRAGVAFVATCLAVYSVAVVPLLDEAWRARNQPWVQEAVLADILEDRRQGVSGHPNPLLVDRLVCVELWSTHELFIENAGHDPSEEMLERLRSRGGPLKPASACVISDKGVFDRRTGQRAVLIGVGTPQWVNRRFVIAKGAWYLGPFHAAGSRYTVSLLDDGWRVDAVEFTWVS